MSWTASTDNVGVTGYKIYRGANGSTPTLLTTTTNNTTSYVDAPVVADTAYDYRVQAIDGAGNSSAQSTVASVTTPATGDSIAPTAPTNLSVDVVDGGQVDLGWSPSTDSGTGISGYRIYRGEGGDPPTTLLASTVGTDVSYQDLTAEGNQIYKYQVVAFDGAGNVSGPSNVATVATPPGLATHTYTFEPTGDATVDETDPTANHGSDTDLAVSDSPTRDSLLQFNLDTPAVHEREQCRAAAHQRRRRLRRRRRHLHHRFRLGRVRAELEQRAGPRRAAELPGRRGRR